MKRFIIAAALAATTVAAPAFAASEKFEMDVNYSSKKLSTVAGAEAEYEHIRKQIEDRCVSENADIRVPRSIVETFCVRKTMDSAVRSIDSELLTQVHAERR
ncbi:hypothetical protein HPO_16935 [Hyphomonas polymorpha PS728]|uniref:UrcA family protein n=1 Tax=Hyphomonas polymorpha PS728 TaxID=1280954 RepID=A0A062V532_9PROT|nr:MULTISPECIES: UrcA family protein [Hyphomonas]AXE65488.1 hypothetical protein BBF93_15580 [Hyphomonas sp. CACIAM 19H1]KCZ97081.1 hypothetical protein HPO_16935 [Hyphomonas polymorpha PS728]